MPHTGSFTNPAQPEGSMSHMPQYGTPAANANSHTIGVYLYTATGLENGDFTVTHSLGLDAPYYVSCTPQGAHDVPTIDPNPSGGSQTSGTMTCTCSGPMTVGDKFLFIFYSVPS